MRWRHDSERQGMLGQQSYALSSWSLLLAQGENEIMHHTLPFISVYLNTIDLVEI